MRECFYGQHGVPPTHANVLGVLSLILWSLILIISVKYLTLILRADNRGEGGILALATLVSDVVRRGKFLFLLGLFGAALLYADGMITPAISVMVLGRYSHQPYGNASVASQSKLISRSRKNVKLNARQLMNGRTV